MNRFSAKYDPNLTKGTWKGGRREDGSRTASMCCPNGHIASLSGHMILEDGFVEPSVVCPWEGCDFHQFVILDGWETGGETKEAIFRARVKEAVLRHVGQRTYEEFGEYVEIGKQSVSNWINGVNVPRKSRMEDLKAQYPEDTIPGDFAREILEILEDR